MKYNLRYDSQTSIGINSIGGAKRLASKLSLNHDLITFSITLAQNDKVLWEGTHNAMLTPKGKIIWMKGEI